MRCVRIVGLGKSSVLVLSNESKHESSIQNIEKCSKTYTESESDPIYPASPLDPIPLFTDHLDVANSPATRYLASSEFREMGEEILSLLILFPNEYKCNKRLF